MADRQGIEIDYCPDCRGVWLDRGELDKIIEETVTSSSRMSAARTFNKFAATVRTAIVHLLSTVHAKGALKTTNHGLARFR